MTQVQTGGSFWFQFAHVVPSTLAVSSCRMFVSKGTGYNLPLFSFLIAWPLFVNHSCLLLLLLLLQCLYSTSSLILFHSF